MALKPLFTDSAPIRRSRRWGMLRCEGEEVSAGMSEVQRELGIYCRGGYSASRAGDDTREKLEIRNPKLETNLKD